MQCPACEENLSRADYNGLQIVKCDSCSGAWLAGAAFTAVCSMDGSGFSPRDVAKLKILAQYKVEKTIKPTDHPCPRCGKKLKTRNFANIAGFFVEQCPGGCGVWVRDGDLDRIRILRSLGVVEEVKVKRKPEAARQQVAEKQAQTAAAGVDSAAPEPVKSASQAGEKPARVEPGAAAARKQPAEKQPEPRAAADKPPAVREKPDSAKTKRSPRIEIVDSEESRKPGLLARIIAALFGRRK